MPSRMPTVVAEFDAVKGHVRLKDDTRPFINDDKTLRLLGEKNKPCKLMVWGDSHAGMLLFMLDEICAHYDVSGAAAVRDEMPPVTGWSGYDPSSGVHSAKVAYNNSVMHSIQQLSENGELKHIILAFRWSYYLLEASRAADDHAPVTGFPDALIATIHRLEKLGLNVSVLLEVPIFQVHVPKTVALHHWHGLGLPRLTKTQHREHQQAYEPLLQRLRNETPHVNVIDASPRLFFKNGEVEFVDEQGVLLYRDGDHLTVAGSMRLKPLFENLLLK